MTRGSDRPALDPPAACAILGIDPDEYKATTARVAAAWHALRAAAGAVSAGGRDVRSAERAELALKDAAIEYGRAVEAAHALLAPARRP